MNIDEMVPTKSRFLTKEDVGEQGKNLTIKQFTPTEVGQEKEARYVIEWHEADFKPMVLNKENSSRLKMIFKTADTNQMCGMKVNVYNDPFVSFGGEVVGGIRLRPVPATAAQSLQPPQQRPPQQRRPAAPPPQDDGMGPPNPPLDAYTDNPY